MKAKVTYLPSHELFGFDGHNEDDEHVEPARNERDKEDTDHKDDNGDEGEEEVDGKSEEENHGTAGTDWAVARVPGPVARVLGPAAPGGMRGPHSKSRHGRVQTTKLSFQGSPSHSTWLLEAQLPWHSSCAARPRLPSRTGWWH